MARSGVNIRQREKCLCRLIIIKEWERIGYGQIFLGGIEAARHGRECSRKAARIALTTQLANYSCKYISFVGERSGVLHKIMNKKTMTI